MALTESSVQVGFSDVIRAEGREVRRFGRASFSLTAPFLRPPAAKGSFHS